MLISISVILYYYVNLLQVVSAMMNNDLMTYLHTRQPKSWKETLALICTVSTIFLMKLKYLLLDGLMSLITTLMECFFLIY